MLLVLSSTSIIAAGSSGLVVRSCTSVPNVQRVVRYRRRPYLRPSWEMHSRGPRNAMSGDFFQMCSVHNAVLFPVISALLVLVASWGA